MSDQAQGGSGDHNAENSTHNDSSQQQPQELPVATKLMQHINTNRIDSAMLATRLLTILFTIIYVIPIFGTRQSAFNKVLLANAATSALRLHQRLPTFTFSREFVSHLLVEDSCHYLMFSAFLFSVQPTILMLMPVSLFALLHAASYMLKLLDLIGQNAVWAARFLISLVEFQATNILKAVAFSEIIIMPLLILYTFTGRAGLLTPFMYYNFLVLRYSSRRNPHTRHAFSELRMVTETLAARSPAIVAKVLRSGINLVSRLAPQPVAPAQ